MSNEIDLRLLKERITKLADEQLIEMVTTTASDYRREALDYAKAELRSRGVDWSAPDPVGEGPVTNFEPEAPLPSVVAPGSMCPCGGRLREGTLVAEKELTIVFSDNREERFVRVTACAQCGQVSLVADYETDIES